MDNRNDGIIRIKKSKSLTPWIALVAFALTAASVYCMLVPLVIYKDNIGSKALFYSFIVIGALGTAYFTGMFIYQIVQLFSPKNAMIISSEGFLDLLNGTEGAGVIPWSNVAMIDIDGGQRPYIKIGLLDVSEVPNIGDAKLRKQLTESGTVMPELYVKPYQISGSLDAVYDALRKARDMYYRSVSPSGRTAVLTDTFMHAVRRSVTDAPGAPAKAPQNSFDAIREDVKQDAPQSAQPAPADTEEKSIDELLKELSGEIEKRRQKLSGDSKKSSEELEDIIRYVKEKK